MSKEDQLSNFLYGLQLWAQAELRRQAVKDLPSAIVAAEGFVDFKILAPNSKGTNRIGRNKVARGNPTAMTSQKTRHNKVSSKSARKDKSQKGFWTCGGDHL